MKNKKGMAQIAIVFLLAIGAFVIASATGFHLASINLAGFDTEGVYVADNGRLECLESSTAESIIKYADQDYTFTCGEDYLVDECKVYVSCSGTSILNPSCAITSPSYKVLQKGTANLLYTTLKPGQSINIKASNAKYLKIEYEFNPYKLYTYERGGKYLSSSSDCCLANQDDLQKKDFEYGDWDCIGKGDFRNYFLNWEKIYGAKIYGNKICMNNALYSLDKITLADGSFVNMQGDKIKDVECCPQQDDNCDSSTFTFKQSGEEETASCSFDYQCANTGNPWDNPLSSTSAYVENCVSGTCVKSSISIECDSDAKCVSLYGEGYGCDLSYDNYGDCIEIGNIAQGYCGDLLCQTGETIDNCPSDCEIECPEGWKLITTEKKEGDYCILGFGVCNDVVEKECKQSTTDWYKIGLLLVLVLFIFLFRNQIFAAIKIGLNKVGVKI